ncbi:MAG: hypothetical protein IJN50_02585 [Clostridia bacterium]|nr:hypothetical protein [Clostridia bacterium]
MKIIKLLEDEPLVLKGEKRARKVLLENEMSADRKVCCSLFDVIIKLVLATKRLESVYGATMGDLEMINAQKRIILRAIEAINDTINMCDIFEEIEMSEVLKRESLENQKVEKISEDIISNLRFYEIINRIDTIIKGYDEICFDLDYEKVNEVAVDLTRIENSLTNIETLVTAKLKNKLNSMQ